MKHNLSSGIAVLTACAALMMTACGQSGQNASTGTSGQADTTAASAETTAGTESAAENVTYKSEINVAIAANPPSLDPQSVNSNIVGGIGIHIYEPLFAMDANYEPKPVLAESYTVSEDGMVYTIKLRQGVKFHNGQEMTADDVVASMNRWLEKSAKANTLIGGSVFEKEDDYTVKLTVNKASSDIIMVLAGPIQFAAIYPASVVENASDEGITEYIGTGPYKLDEWKQDQYVKLSRYEDYQSPEGEASGLTGEKTAATETIYYRVVTDAATRIAGVQTGQYEIAQEIPLERYEELSADPNLKLSIETGGTLNLFLNTSKGVLANETLRQAVLAALNCEDIMLASYGDPNLYSLNPGWCNPSDAQWGSEAGSEYYNQNNIEKAKALLEEAGYQNEPVVLVTTPDYNEMYYATLVVQEELNQAGFNAQVESYDFATFMEHRSNPDQFDLFITSNSYNMLPIQLSVLDKGWAGLDREEVTDGIAAIRGAATTEEASAAWDDLQEFLYEYGAASVLGHYTGVTAMQTGVEGTDYLRFPIYWNTKAAE
jgi:peptide/nickel transport system substrate-binding protein